MSTSAFNNLVQRAARHDVTVEPLNDYGWYRVSWLAERHYNRVLCHTLEDVRDVLIENGW